MIFNKNNLYDIQITSIKLYEQETDKELMDLTGNDCSMESSTDIFIPNKKYNINKTLMDKFDSDLTLELGSVEINKDILNAVLGIDISRFPDAYDIQYMKVVQARTHKKKRINKKWLKRYGYKQILCKTKGWKFNHYTDGTFELIK